MAMASGSENLVGASIFWAYIAAALYFTGLIVLDLVTLWAHSHDVKRMKQRSIQEMARRREKAQLFIGLSILSFSVLSYHMLSFLIDSYIGWAHASNVALPKSVLGGGGMLNLSRKRVELELWRWSKASTLFQDFAHVICDDPQRYWWTLQALLYSFGWNVYMCIEGVRRQIPHLWAYFVLDQILPVSFTQNLFCVAVILRTNVLTDRDLVPAKKTTQWIVLLAYLVSVTLAPATADTAGYLVVLFATRALLFAPYLLLSPARSAPGSKLPATGGERSFFGLKIVSAQLSLCLYMIQTWRAAPAAGAFRALNSSHAVSALGYDYLIAIASLCLFVLSSKM